MKEIPSSGWLVLAVALGLFAYSIVSVVVNGFGWYKLYPFALGLVNLVALRSILS